MAKRKVSQEETIEAVEVKAVPSQPFLERNQNIVLYVIGAGALLLLGYWLYKTMVVAPKQNDAVAALWQAEQQFGRDSFQLALEPSGGFDGFLAISDKYSGTKAGNTAKYYAGVCYLQMGDFDNALKYLDGYSPSNDVMAAMKYGTLADCYSEKKDFSKALSYYEKAANASDNDLIAAYYLRKLGMLNENQGNKDAALKAYERLRKDHPNQQSADWRDIEKYIYRAGAGAK